MDERQVFTERATCVPKKKASPPRVSRIHTDNSVVFLKAWPNLHGTHDTNTPHLSETNGVVEKPVRRQREETAAMLVQHGFLRNGRNRAMECRCYLRNALGNTTHEKRVCAQFDGPIKLLDQQLCATTLMTVKDDNDSCQFGKNPLNTLCLGCVRRVGDGWSGDLPMAHIENIPNCSASELLGNSNTRAYRPSLWILYNAKKERQMIRWSITFNRMVLADRQRTRQGFACPRRRSCTRSEHIKTWFLDHDR